MDLLSKSDDEIFAIGKPFWENLVRSSNLKDYGGFTRDFSTQMLFGANEVELGKQWANNKLITNLKETYSTCEQTKARLDTIIFKIDYKFTSV